MKLIVGLGNPGAKYAGHRHNIGFMCLDRIAQDHGFGPWKSKFQGQVIEGRFGSDRVVLLKPETFMNNSGQSVVAAAQFYKLEPENVIVLHDEIDLAPGKVRFKQAGGHAGHNGLRSIHAHLGADYGRVRLGVGHPGHKDRVPAYVLHDFAKADQDWLDDVLRGVSDGAEHLARGDAAKFMNAVALRVSPPRSGTGDRSPKEGPKDKPAEKKQPSPPKPEAAPTPAPEPEAPRSAMQKLMDKFK
ncbi:aminoacyl-tRNA hydrolase [Pseudosulfitobacter koreensis]|uniref:Peptidyl-tRNA hydrolase n=1 Tax=Pseudosulfitobacter koreensis TaxID=2968472 RepID=A0ABT1YZE7_9RHOB|nr:aminoacyl-tRNA hydrolase [Pseudosulfitobacter koreense]MCR8826268.1 aminoacyl-tRNA hydrolase [Pseudosulfitobacter koreense]